MYGPLRNIIPERDQAFLQFILSLSSLNILAVDSCGVLDLPPQLPIDGWDVLPSLNTLKIGYDLVLKWEVDRIVIFLTWRKAMERLPIDVFGVTTLSKLELGGEDWSSLDNVAGLKVAWRDGKNNIEEYICGSGWQRNSNSLENSTANQLQIVCCII